MHPVAQILIVLTIYVLTCARITRLINSDMILDRPRLWVVGRLRHHQDAVKEAGLKGQHSVVEIHGAHVRRWANLHYFLECPWCVSIWVCLALAYPAVRLVCWPWWAALPVALAASHLIGVFAFAADTEDTEVVEGD
jgi:hypothetical protein